MPKTSSGPDPADEWRVLAKCHARGAELPLHQHRTAQLVFALTGIMSVQADGDRWTIPPQRALWIPPQHPHAIQMLAATETRMVYFQPAFVGECVGFLRRDRLHVMAVSSLMRELVLGLFDEARAPPMQNLMARLLLHALGESECLPTNLPMPTTEGLCRAAKWLIDSNSWHLSMHEIACAAAMSERTFTRRFTEEVGMSFRAWRQRARLIASLDLLASHHSIKSIAHTMQFQSSAAYATAFGKLFGCPPQEFRQRTEPTSLSLA